MTNDILALKKNCEESQKNLLLLSGRAVKVCEEIIGICTERRNTFGDVRDERAGREILDMCFSRVEKINSISNEVLDQVLTIYNSVMKYSEIGGSAIGSFSTSYFFSAASEIGRAFEMLFEREVKAALNGIIDGLDLDGNGTNVNIHAVVSNAAKIAISVSKATKFYFEEG